MFYDSRYGFRTGRSMANLLTVISECIYRTLNLSGETRAVAFDISKAFDKVWHAGLLKKLQVYGVKGSMFDIVSSFLTDRKIKVVIDGQTSSCYPINAGIPQGFVLGLTLFLLFINDLLDNILYELAIYADDSTLYSCLGKTAERFDN